MTSVSQKRATFISQRLEFLQDQGNQLNKAVGEYVGQIIQTGQSWTEGGDNKMGFLELCQMVDSAVDFLWRKFEEISGGSGSFADNQLSQTSCNQFDLTPQSIAATTSTSATSYNKLTSSLQTTASHRQIEEPFQTTGTDENQLKPVLARIAVIEEAWCSLRSNAEKVAEQQSDIDEQLKALLSKLLESEKKNNSKFRKVKEQIKEINDTQIALDQEQETRLQCLEKQLQKLSKAQDRIKEEMESQVELTEKLVHVPDQLESVKEKLDVFDARIGRIMDDCSNKHQDIEHVTRDLADKVMANTETIKVISVDQDQKTTMLRELETRMQTLEADNGRNVEDIQKQVEKGETNFQIMCQMLSDRLTPLEQLRTCLNEKASTRDENIKQLAQVIQEVTVMSPRLQQLELKCSRPRCGFSAGTWLNNAAEGETISPYEDLIFNVGGNFDADSGIFTAPVDGLYVTAISVYLYENKQLTFYVKHNKKGQGQSSATDVCWCSAAVKDTQACDVSVVDMKAGDTLFSYLTRDNTEYGTRMYFSCVLVS